MFRILLVDDEPNIISALKRLLSRIAPEDLDGDPLEITGFTSPVDALEKAHEKRYDLVICDYRMPCLTGIEFLGRFIQIQPHVSRMILSGCADRDVVIEALNSTQISRFLDKPWGEHQLRQTVIALLHESARTLENARAMLRGRSTSAIDAGAATGQTEVDELSILEFECPGITYVDLDDEGAINLPMDEI